MKELQEGAVDIARDLSPDELGNLRSVPGVKMLSVPTRNHYHLGLNNTIAPYDNMLVRQALSFAVPYETIVNDVFRGRALEPRSPVARKAKAQLAEVGYADGFDFTPDIQSGDPVIEELAILIQFRRRLPPRLRQFDGRLLEFSVVFLSCLHSVPPCR